jgi:hydroxyethylthiazole kinase-like sugar kinase family protein
MTDDKITDPLVDAVKIAVVHFGKAAFEVATGVGALLTGITQTVISRNDDDDDSGPQTVEVE